MRHQPFSRLLVSLGRVGSMMFILGAGVTMACIGFTSSVADRISLYASVAWCGGFILRIIGASWLGYNARMPSIWAASSGIERAAYFLVPVSGLLIVGWLKPDRLVVPIFAVVSILVILLFDWLSGRKARRVPDYYTGR